MENQNLNQQPIESQIPQPQQQVPIQPEQPVISPQQPKTNWLLLSIILGVALISYAGVAYWQGMWPFGGDVIVGESPTPSITPTSTPDETADWKTYTNTKYDYSIKFPSDFNVVVRGMTGSSGANPGSDSVFITNNKIGLNINPNVISSGESEIKGIIVDKGFKELAQSAENRYTNQILGSAEFVKFSYLTRSYAFAELAGFMEGIIENTKESENYGRYSETYRLQTKHSGRFFEVNYSNQVPKADKDSTEFKAGLDKLEKIIATIKFTN